MVRNLNGGKSAKSLARKLTSSVSSSYPVPTCEFEKIAIVTKIHGSSCDVMFADDTKLLCHIRNKFRGRNKRQNVILLNSIILVGLRDWESTPKNCDLLFVYESSHLHNLSQSFMIPSIDHGFTDSASDIQFHNESNNQMVYDDVIPSNTNMMITMEDGHNISIDDI